MCVRYPFTRTSNMPTGPDTTKPGTQGGERPGSAGEILGVSRPSEAQPLSRPYPRCVRLNITRPPSTQRDCPPGRHTPSSHAFHRRPLIAPIPAELDARHRPRPRRLPHPGDRDVQQLGHLVRVEEAIGRAALPECSSMCDAKPHRTSVALAQHIPRSRAEARHLTGRRQRPVARRPRRRPLATGRGPARAASAAATSAPRLQRCPVVVMCRCRKSPISQPCRHPQKMPASRCCPIVRSACCSTRPNGKSVTCPTGARSSTP